MIVNYLDYKKEEQFTFEMFIKIMQELELKLSQQNEQQQQSPQDIMSLSPSKGPYPLGPAYKSIPRVDNNFLPDQKVVEFLRVLSNYKQDCLKNSKFQEAKEA